MEEPDGASRTVCFGGLGPAQGCQGPPVGGGANPATGPCLLPHCDASRARPRRAGMSKGIAQMKQSVKNKIRTLSLAGPLPFLVITGLVPVIPMA
jgi:hypothetical protein